MYQYSLESFQQFYSKAIFRTKDQGEERTAKLVFNIRETIYQWIARGLFEKHKIIFLTLLVLRLMVKKVIKVDFEAAEMNFLLTCTPKVSDNPLKEWLPASAWNAVMRLADLDEFRKLPESMEKELPARFKDWFNEVTPEDVKLPSDWRKLDATPFKKLLVIRALRPDRMQSALTTFISNCLPYGIDFVNMDSSASFKEILQSAYEDATQEAALNIPIFFILSPGADPVKDVELMGKQYSIDVNRNNFFNISLGQGMDVYAEAKLDAGFKDGYWIM